jgi:hypothetical protein
MNNMKTLDLPTKNTLGLSGRAWFRVILNILTATVISILFGRTMAPYFSGLPIAASGWYMLALVGTGWVAQIVIALQFAGNKTGAYLYRLCRLMVTGVLILLPVMSAHLIFSYVWCGYHTISVVISLSVMLYLHSRIIKDLHMSRLFTLSWFLCLALASGSGLLLLNHYFPVL